MSTLGHMLNRVPPGLFRDGAKIGAPDVNELLPATLQIASNNKKQVRRDGQIQRRVGNSTGRWSRLLGAAPVTPCFGFGRGRGCRRRAASEGRELPRPSNRLKS